MVASDNLNENYTTVVIHIKDVNDNPPTFNQSTYETQITEEDGNGLPKSVIKVQISFRFYCTIRCLIPFIWHEFIVQNLKQIQCVYANLSCNYALILSYYFLSC